MKYDDNFEKVMDYVFNSEGGYVNHKYDRGGPTNFGVTQKTFNAWRKQKGLPIKDVKNITKEEAKKLYYEEFWNSTGASDVEDLREAYLLFDTSIICGPYNAKVMYKKSNGDIYKFLKERAKFHNVDIEKNPMQKEFKEGWFNRLKTLENNMNEIVNKGYYVPPYQNEITPFDKEYKGELNTESINKLSEKERQNKRNKYLYLINKNKEKYNKYYGTTTGQAAPVSNSVKSNSSNPQTVKSEKPKMTSKDFSDMIRQKYKTQQAENNKKISKIFRTSTPNSGNGHWVTMNGAHVFIEDK